MRLPFTSLNPHQQTLGVSISSVIRRSPQRLRTTALASLLRALCLLLLLGLSSLSSWAQCSGVLRLSSQAQVNAFPSTCTDYQGLIVIEGADITDLSPLANLQRINPISVIEGGALYIHNNPQLTSLAGLENLTTVNNELSISNNPKLTSLAGLNNLTTAGLVSITDNANLASMAGLSSLGSVRTQLRIQSNPELTNLTGLESLTTVEELIIALNARLASIAGLSSLSSGYIFIASNPELTSLTGLENLTTARGVQISNNAKLTTCAITSICQLLATPPPSGITISGNATGCASVAEVQALCDGLAVTGFAASSDIVCVGSPVTFTATATNAALPYAYTLTNGSSTSMGTASTTTFSQSLVASGSGNQSFTLTVSSGGQPATATTTVTVNSHPDYQALADLFNATNGPNWTNKAGWLQSCDPCTGNGGSPWQGVRCSTGRVNFIQLVGNNLTGTLPASLGSLTNLAFMDLRSNHLSGSLPESLSALTRLSNLNLSDNQLSGLLPSSWSRIYSLNALRLSNNQLSGSLPSSWSALTMLTDLRLSINQLSGILPESWGGFTRMTQLYLNNNQLSGPLPSGWSRLVNLTDFSLNNNQLSGILPESWGGLTRMTGLNLSNNQLSGCFPASYSVFCGKFVNFTFNPGLPGGGNFSAFCSSGVGQCTSLAVSLSASSSTVCAGSTVTVSASVSGVVGTPTYQWKKDGVTLTGNTSATTASLILSNVQPSEAGSYSVVVTDGANTVTSSAFSLLVSTAPTASIDPPTATLTCTNPTAMLTASGGGTYRWEDNSTNASRSVSSAGTYSVTVTSANGCTATASAAVTVESNTPPVITTLTVGTGPQAINTAFAFSAQVSDATNNLTTASIAWGDGATTTLTPAAGGGTLSATHSYTAAGVYRISLSLTDACGATATQTYEYTVAYDPTAGFVTGAGWIESPAGAYSVDPTLSGKANFGFQARYQKGATVPTGNTNFQFKAGSLDFESTVYEWLTVAGARAQFKGSGTINGAGDYGFMLTAIDGAINGGGGTDKFRIKIWQKLGGAIVYDNQRNTADDATPSTAIGGGQIVIHTPNGRNAREASSIEPTLTAEGLLLRNYPNPIGQQTLIEFMLPQGGDYSLLIVDTKGSLVRQLQSGTAQAGQLHQVSWEVGQTPAGLYITQLITPQGVKAIKLLVK